MQIFDWYIDTDVYYERIAMVAYFIMGVVTAWSGFYYLITHYNIEFLDYEPYQVTKLILSGCLLLLSLLMIKGPHMTTAMLTLFVAVSTFSFSFSALFMDIEGDPILDILLSIPIMAISFFNYHNGRSFRGSAIFILALSMLLSSSVSNPELNPLEGLAFIISGIMMMLIGIFSLVRGNKAESDDNRDYGFEMVAVAGFLLMGIYAILSSVDVYDMRYYVVALTLAITITSISLQGLLDGILVESLIQFMFGFSGILFSIGRMFGGEGYVITDLAIASVIGVCAIMLVLRKQYVIGIGTGLFSLLVIPGFIFEQGVSWGIGSLIMAPFIMYYSISRWIYIETRKEILPLLE